MEADLSRRACCLRVTIAYLPRLNWSLLRAGVPLIWRLAVENCGAAAVAGCALRIELPGFLDSGAIALRELAPGETLELDAARLPWVRRDFARAAQLTRDEETSLHLTLRASDGPLVGSALRAGLCPLTLLPPDEWVPGLRYDDERAAFALDPRLDLAQATIDFPGGGTAQHARREATWQGQLPLPAAVAALLCAEHPQVELIKDEAMEALAKLPLRS